MPKYEVTETFLTRLLGTAPASKEVYQMYILQRRQDEADRRAKAAERKGVEMAPPQGTESEELDTINEEAGVTVFHNDLGQKTEAGTDGKGLFLLDYQVAGFWKEAAEILLDAHGIKQPRSKLDNFMLVEPRRVYITDANGKVVEKPDGKLERPLRAMTMQGPRVSLACSEVVDPGRKIAYTVDFLPYLKVGSGREAKGLDFNNFVKMIVEFGKRKGRGQWRNGGYGKISAQWRRVNKI